MTEDVFIFPMSFAQQRLWFLDQLEPNSSSYNIPLVLRLADGLDVAALQQAIDEIVRRHEVFRTTFATREGEPVQVVAPVSEVRLLVTDLQSLSAEAQEAEAQRLANEEAQRPFDLRHGPLLRVTLLRLSDEAHVLLVTMHHIISDGWSMGIFRHEVETLYEAFAQGKPSALPELPIQYADFSIWQREWLSGETLERQLAYWREQLADAPPLLALPTDYPRPAVQRFRGASEHFELSATLAQRLRQLSQKAGTTLFMTLLAGWGVLLSRYGGKAAEHVVIGSPIANRNRKEIEPLIGFFVNTLLFHLDFSHNPTFSECLAQVRQKALDAYAHQDLPFEKLVDELKPERNLSHSPLFQVMFVLQNAPPGDDSDEEPSDEQPSDGTMTPIQAQDGTAKFDLTLMMDEDDLSGVWEYNTDLFDRTTIQRMHQHFERLLEGIVANPQQRVAELPLLTERERQQILVEWNQTEADYPAQWSIHEWVESQVRQTPHAVAVAANTPSPMLGGKSELTYYELNARANQLAHYLRRLGVKAEVPVAICAERSLEMMIGLLAILKAGGAYVPLDPSYPKERLAFVLEDALGEVKVLLTQQKWLDHLPEAARQPTVICLDTDVAAWQSEENLLGVVEPDNLAYIIYTSGSTGKPKGVQVSHRNLVHSTHARVTYYDEPPTSFLLLSSFAFDSSVAGIFWTLCTGGRLVLPPQDFQQEPHALAELIAQHQASYLLAIPSFYSLILTQTDLAKLASLRAVIVAGETCPTELVKSHYERLPNTTLFNEYGPTEATVWSTVYKCRFPEERSQVPIGHAIANAKLYILDDHLQPVPLGVPGQLYIGGAGVTRGYLNRPKLTKERFIRNPFGQGKLYNSGDMARYLPDTQGAGSGCIDFLGRADDQVKIRGFRIELGEIHAYLSQHANVREAVVMARQDGAGSKRLVAYFVPTEGLAPTNSDLRGYLLEHLPDYMVPSVFLPLDVMPLMPNGKVNRRALPAPEEVRASHAGDMIMASTEAEKILSQIWAAVLNLDETNVGIHDNFFELGGDSILSIQIVGRANQAGLRLTPRLLFQHQTIADLASVAGSTDAIEAEQGIVSGTAPLTPIQQWFFALNQPEMHHYNHDVLLEVPADTQPALLKQVVQHLLTHHDALRLRFRHSPAGWQQEHVAPTDDVPFSVIDLSHVGVKKQEQEQADAIEKAANQLQTSLNLSDGPLMRVALFTLGANQAARLLIVVHHLVVDGVSWRILLEDLQTAYDALAKGDTIQLPPKTTSFKAWATELSEYAQTEGLVAEKAYWLAQSHDMSLPRDENGEKTSTNAKTKANTIASAANVLVSLSAEETRTLLQEVPEVYKTQINDVLLTALVKTFANWTGERSLLIDLEGHGREELTHTEHLDLSRTVGWFTSAFPVYLALGEETNVGQELQKIKEQLRGIPQRGIGYGLLRYLNQDMATREQLQAQPPAEVSFNYLGQFDQVTQDASLFEGANESGGRSQSMLAKRPYLLDVIGLVSDGMLEMSWTYSQTMHQAATIERLAAGFIDALREIIAHCLTPDAGGRIWADFDLAGIDHEALLEIAGQLAEVDD